MKNYATTWKKMITAELSRQGETWDDLVSIVFGELADSEGEPMIEPLDRVFDADLGGARGHTFTMWTTHRVYFPSEYDGAEGCDSVARNPDGKPTRHI